MDKQPLVCCIVLNWNGRELVLACLASLAQSRYGNALLVVVDNASTDGSVVAVRAQYPNVEVIENDTNLRWAGGNNVGIHYGLAQGADYILLLNNDIEVAPDMIARLVEAAEADPGIGLLAPKIYYHAQRDLIWYAGGRASLWRGLFWHVGIRQQDRGQFDSPGPIDYITGCAMLIRQEVAREVGDIDTAFIAYGEDVDYSFRVQAAGFGLALVPGARMWHKVSAYWGATSWRKIRVRLRSQLTLYRRYSPPWAWFTTIPLFLLLDGLRVMVLMAAGRFTSLKGTR